MHANSNIHVMKKIRIIIADDHAVMRMGLIALFDTVGEFEVVAEAADGEEAVELATRYRPDVVIMDLVMPILDGVSATEKITKSCPDVRVLLLTTYGSSDGIAHALDAGASGAVLKSASNDELIAAIKAVAAGQKSISGDVQRLLQDDPPIKPLTPRQAEILSYVTRGLTNQDIAKVLGIRVDSVAQNLSAIFAKLNAANRAEAITIALRKHLLKL
jgi:DNA-binding NarL/FixJ family response regulator